MACPGGWTTVANRCFRYYAGSRNYAASKVYCVSQGGRVASLHNNAENSAIIRITSGLAYIGAESDGRGRWRWEDGTPWWQPASHQHDGIRGTSETKIAYHPPDRKWHDWATGGTNMGVICARNKGPSGPPPVTITCGSGWRVVGSRCYKFFSGTRNYAASQSYCRSMNARVASIHNDAENNAVVPLVSAVAYLGAIGNGRGSWRWEDQTPWWQPAGHQHDGLRSGETRVAINPGDRKWHDWGQSDTPLAVVCMQSR